MTRKQLLIVLVLLVGIAVAAWRYRISRPNYRYALAKQAIASQNFAEAELLASRLERSSIPELARLIQAEVLLHHGHPVAALKQLEHIRPESKYHTDGLVLVGKAYLSMQQIQNAMIVFAQVLEKDSKNAEAHRGMASGAYDLGQLNLTVHHLEQVALLDPQDGKPHRLIASIEKDLSFFDRAELSYREALKRQLPPDFRQEALIELAQVQIERVLYPEALTTLDQFAQEFPEKEDSTVTRVEALNGVGRTTEAIKLADEALPKYPMNARLHRLRGSMALEARELELAQQVLEKARQLAPGDDVVHYLLGQTYTALGKTAEATASLKLVSEIRADKDKLTKLSQTAMQKPWDRAVRLEMADICDRLAKPDLAKMWREAARNCPPEPRN